MTAVEQVIEAEKAALAAFTAFENANNLRAARAEFIADEFAAGRPVHGTTVSAYLAARNEATSAMHAWVTASNAALAMGAEFEKGDAA